MDFTIKIYRELLEVLSRHNFHFQTFADFDRTTQSRTVILRHDVDNLPRNSLEFARIQNDLGICGTYYFRSVPQSFSMNIIEQISCMGHEIGYHYEDVSFTADEWNKSGKKRYTEKELTDEAIKRFQHNLNRLRKIASIRTICMHGSPLSRWDNRILWKYHDYRNFDIMAEPYFDLDFSRVLYLTDTGRRWNGGHVSIRDNLNNTNKKNLFNDWVVQPHPDCALNLSMEHASFQQQYIYKKTKSIMASAERSGLPDHIMMTFHPQRWTNDPLPWLKELIFQRLKNVIKYFLVKNHGFTEQVPCA